MHDAFISYARADSKEFVGRLARALEAAGKDVWVDLDDIAPASRWREALQDGVLGSGAFVYVISPGAVSSEHCRTELDHAAERNKRIIPVAHLEVPDAQIPAAVGSLNWIPQDGTFDEQFERSVGLLVRAIETDQAAVRSHTRWQERAEGWAGAERDRSLLARGSELAEAEEWLTAQTGREPRPTALQAEWVAASRKTNSRRQGLVLGASLVALAITAVLGVLALAQRNEAVEQRDAARAGALATDAVANLEVDPELSLILALEAVRTDANERTEHALKRALLASRVRERFVPGARGALDAVEFSADGRLVAIAADDGRATVWELDTGEQVAALDAGLGPVLDVAFTPDAERAVTVHSDGAVRVWNVEEERALERIQLSDSGAITVDVSPNGRRIAAGAVDGTAAAFALDGSGRVEFEGMEDRVYSVEFTPDGDRVLTSSGDGFARLWDAGDGAPAVTFRSHGHPQLDAEMSPDGSLVATANRDGSVVLWDAATAEPVGDPVVPPNRSSFVSRVAFVPGANALVTSGAGGFVQAWDVATREEPARYRGHRGFVLDLSASPDGQRVLTAGADGTARLWDFSQRRFAVRAQSYTTSVDFDPEGERLVFADGSAPILDTETGREVDKVAPAQVAHGAFFSPDGALLSTADGDGTVRLWDLKSGGTVPPTLEAGGGNYLFAAHWSADGSRLLAAAFQTAPKVYDRESGELIRKLPRAGDFIFDVAMNPAGTRVAVVTGDPEVPIYDVETGERAALLKGHRDRVNQAAYSADGRLIVTASDDGTARVWSADTATAEQVISHDGQPIRAVAMSDDGALVITATAGGELRVWDTGTGLELLRITGADTAVDVAPGGELIAGALTQAQTRATVSVFECDVCGATLDELEALAERRITREPTAEERERYLSG